MTEFLAQSAHDEHAHLSNYLMNLDDAYISCNQTSLSFMKIAQHT
jgi:hypothetical protein